MSLNDIDLKRVGANMKKERLSRSIKQEFMARKVGISKSHYSRIENGERDTSIRKILLVAAILNIPPSTLFE